jgi:hypothetical protein
MTMTGGDSLAGPLVAALRDLWAREGYDYVPDPVELAEAARARWAMAEPVNLNALPAEEREAVNRLAETWEENGTAAAIRRELFERAARRGGGEVGRQV